MNRRQLVNLMQVNRQFYYSIKKHFAVYPLLILGAANFKNVTEPCSYMCSIFGQDEQFPVAELINKAPFLRFMETNIFFKDSETACHTFLSYLTQLKHLWCGQTLEIHFRKFYPEVLSTLEDSFSSLQELCLHDSAFEMPTISLLEPSMLAPNILSLDAFNYNIEDVVGYLHCPSQLSKPRILKLRIYEKFGATVPQLQDMIMEVRLLFNMRVPFSEIPFSVLI
uniref:Uncharacterized protein n=1 Tax=Ditylenchus dipsaci TaxID=166011 RepID=A0A915DQM1_9BILA